MTFVCQWTNNTTGYPASSYHATEADAERAAQDKTATGSQYAVVFEIEGDE